MKVKLVKKGTGKPTGLKAKVKVKKNKKIYPKGIKKGLYG